MTKYDYAYIKALAEGTGQSIKNLLALAPKNDPFYAGTPGDRLRGEWFTRQYSRAGYSRANVPHLRRVHYWIVSQENPVIMPDGLPLVVSAQGVDAQQYLRCVQALMPFIKEGDILGLGGWCIIGKMHAQMMPVFADTVKVVIPFLEGEGIQRVHIWGVIFPPALALLYNACNERGIAISTDSMGVNLNPAFGGWGYNSYARPASHLVGEHRARHARLTRAWLASFSSSVDYLSRYPAAVSHFAGLRTTRPCANCGADMVLKRQHSKTCSSRCRKALSRRMSA